LKSDNKKTGSLWSTRLGIYFAAVGSAVGLGNIWRFPFVVSENGGGAFVLVYIFLGLVVGVPLLICELMLGRLTRKGILVGTKEILSSAGSLNKPPWLKFLVRMGSYLMLVVAFLMLAYLTLISSWVLYFLLQFIKSLFVSLPMPVGELMTVLKSNFLGQCLLLASIMVIVIMVVVRGGESLFEKWVSYLVPLFAFLLIILAIKSLSLDVSAEAVKYFLYPDFSKLSFSSVGYALGHIFFTLSIGLGLTVSFGRFLNPKTNIPLTGFRVAAIDSSVSIFAGLLVFPLVISGLYGATGTSGPSLVFETVPNFLFKIDNGKIFGCLLFLCLFISAIGACIGLLHTLVTNIKEAKKSDHLKTTWVCGVVGVVLSLVPTLFFSKLDNIFFFEKSLFELFDIVLVNLLLPTSCFMVLLMVYFFVDKQTRKSEFFGENNLIDKQMFSQWMFALKYLIPIIYIFTYGSILLSWVL